MNSVQGMMEVSPFKRLNTTGVLSSPFLVGQLVSDTEAACASQQVRLEYLAEACKDEACRLEDVERQHELRNTLKLSGPTVGELPTPVSVVCSV